MMTLLGPLGYSAPTDEGPGPWPVTSWGWVYLELADAWRAAQDRADNAQDELAAYWAKAAPQ